MKKAMRIIISGGGTGGHIFPAISIANEIMRVSPHSEILFVGALGKMEMERVPAAGYKIEGLPVAGLKRKLSLSNLLLPFKVLKSLRGAAKIIDDFKPDAAIGVGGYASAPLLYMAGRKKIPYLIQEQNSFAGLANRILSKKAKKICVAYEGMNRFFPEDKILITGNPIRSGIQMTTPELKAEAREYFGIKGDKKILLVIGGSLGARTLNTSVEDWISAREASDIEIIWQSGKYYKEEVELFLKENNRKYVKNCEFIDRMDLAYAAADVIITRAGAGTISELSVAKKACIFVPSPNVAEDHQTCNAKALVDKRAAMMVKDAEAHQYLMSTAMELLNDTSKIEELEENIGRMGYKQSASIIVNEVFKLTGNKG